jgi:hypothetical protein
MASSAPLAAREILNDAEISPSSRTDFLDSIRAFLTDDTAAFSAPTDPAELKIWGEALTEIASYLFATARALTPKPPKPSPKKVYELTPSEVELWQEIQNSRSKSQVGGSELQPMPSSDLFVVDHITDAEALNE